MRAFKFSTSSEEAPSPTPTDDETPLPKNYVKLSYYVGRNLKNMNLFELCLTEKILIT